ncbi:Uncharacterised protein [Mycobacteroides abscessus subsp. abscessus]|nr:Uncharacterised protein [Mycobacteroides abscessus subsp. abscessus]
MPRVMRAATRVMVAAATMSMGCSTRRNCSTPKSYSTWNTDRPMMRPPKANARMNHSSLPSGRSSTPTSDSPAPPMSIRWVGPQRVTSWPKMRCQMSSRGKPISAYRPAPAMRMPPTGAYQVRVIRTAAAPGFSSRGRTMASMPAVNRKNSPARMK